MVEKMKALLRKLFVDNWQRKLLAIILSMIIWMVINHSITTTRTIDDIKVRVINIPENQTVKGMLQTGYLKDTIALTITGNTSLIENINGNDLEVVVDATDQNDEWTAIANKNNLFSTNPEMLIEGNIKNVQPKELNLQLAKLVTERVEVYLRKPIGPTPKEYTFLDIFPHQLYITITGEENIVKDLKAKGLHLTFNLDTISKNELDTIKPITDKDKETISFFVPTSWKKIDVPEISTSSIEIDDPLAKSLRIVFIKETFITINTQIPVTLYFPLKNKENINPKTVSIETNDFIQKTNNLYVISAPLLVKGVTDLYLDTVKDMIEIIIVVEPNSEKSNLAWNLQTIIPIELEEEYIERALKLEENIKDLDPELKQFYLRSQFRHFNNSFRLWLTKNKKLSLKIQLKDDKVVIEPR